MPPKWMKEYVKHDSRPVYENYKFALIIVKCQHPPRLPVETTRCSSYADVSFLCHPKY